MSEQQYDIIFRGDIVLGHQLTDVKVRLQQLFKTDAEKVDALFSGRPVPLKRNLDLASAQKYRDALIKAGVQVEVAPTKDAKVATASQPEAAKSASASQQPLQQTAPAPTEQTPREQAATNNKESEAWSLAPVGTYLLPAAAYHSDVPRYIETTNLSLRPVGSNLLDVSEQQATPRASVTVPNFDLSDLGADLLRAEEKVDLPLLDIDVGDWDIAELGADMLSGAEKPNLVLPIINIPNIGLAPVGSDLGQLKPQITPLSPDISGLGLAD